MADENAPTIKVAKLRYTGNQQFIGESPSGHAVIASFAHENGTAATPMELLLISLGGCTGADVSSILQKNASASLHTKLRCAGKDAKNTHAFIHISKSYIK